jgi:hypothetical protein
MLRSHWSQQGRVGSARPSAETSVLDGWSWGLSGGGAAKGAADPPAFEAGSCHTLPADYNLRSGVPGEGGAKIGLLTYLFPSGLLVYTGQGLSLHCWADLRQAHV